jgi:hypothetical protein
MPVIGISSRRYGEIFSITTMDGSARQRLSDVVRTLARMSLHECEKRRVPLLVQRKVVPVG